MPAAPTPALPDERLATGTARLATLHAGRFAVETVQRLLTDSHQRPAAMGVVRRIRDDIDHRITGLLAGLPST
ncbi:hypothetical protein ACFU3E_03735 [Streptomyces sp. NPDC057424]|uniref:hypothetical protein n=1 Tax=Streptomyces sp. NPDC057424 TaxID=3346127 RepID=UPI0036BE3229